MSICRWHDDCDVYAYFYSSDDRIAINVADYRGDDDQAQSPIGLVFDGKEFIVKGASEFRDRMKILKAAGYRIPDRLLTWEGRAR